MAKKVRPVDERPVYLDCNATTPVDPRVADVVIRQMLEECGNAGSTSHEFGIHAKHAVEHAREQVASVVGAKSDEVIFTSGATESTNLALLGLASFGEREGRKHIISTQIEHKAVLEPLRRLQERGLEITLIPPTRGGWVEPGAIREALRPETLLVSVMHVNNETGVVQPLDKIADALAGHEAYFHTDAAQGFGKELALLQIPRIDLVSVSGHKIYGPMGIGALVARRRRFDRPPLSPLVFGGGQERALRPGTLPVPLISGMGVTAELAQKEAGKRAEACRSYRQELLQALAPFQPVVHGDPKRTLPHVLNLSLPGFDSEAVMLALKDHVAISNGSACTSSSYEPSHVLLAMGLSSEAVQTALRWSWSFSTPRPSWERVTEALNRLT